MTSREIDIFDNPFRDPVYEEMGFMFDPDRNQYYEIVQDPRLGEFRRYLSPRNGRDEPLVSQARSDADFLRAVLGAESSKDKRDRMIELMMGAEAKAAYDEREKLRKAGIGSLMQ